MFRSKEQARAIPCEVRLAMNADKLIEDTFITLKEY
jgi:hypothetical protein